MKQNKFSVLIIFYNEGRALGRTLKSIFAMDYPKDLIEVVCVDDGSTDGSSLVVENYTRNYNNIKLFKQKNRGLSYSYNKGLKYCSGDIVLFLDAHMYLKNKDTFHLLNNYFSRYPNVAGVCGTYRTLYPQDKNFVRDIRRFTLFKKGNKERMITLENFTTFSSAVGAYRRSVFKRCKFPKSFGNSYGEDVLVQILLHNQGYDFLYTPRIVGIHDAQINTQKLLRKMLFEIRSVGNILYYLTEKEKKTIVPYLHYFLSYPLFLVVSFGMFIANPYFFFPLVILALAIETRDAFNCFRVRGYSFKQKLLTFNYLLVKELLQGLYIPYYLVFEKKIGIKRFLVILKQFILWEFKKMKQFVKY